MNHMSDLAAALDALLEGATAAFAVLPNEDTATAAAQATKAVGHLEELGVALTSSATDVSLHILHGLNNKLTGAMSLTMLAREELPPGHAADSVLALVEARARAAAEVVRLVSLAIKDSKPLA